jgi:WD40 repeat protein
MRETTLYLWNGQSSTLLDNRAGHSQPIEGVRLLSNGRVLSWSRDKTLRLWDSQSGCLLATLEGHTSSIENALELANGRVLSWSVPDFHTGDCSLRLWDARSGAPLATLEGHSHRITGVLLLTGGRFLSWSSREETLRLWDGQNGTPLATLDGHTDWVVGVRLLANGHILSWAQDKTLRLWDGQTGAPLATLSGHACWQIGVRLLGNGRILSWSESHEIFSFSEFAELEYTLRLWDGESGALLATLIGHNKWVEDALELSDGRILSWSWDGTLRLWDSQTGAPLATLVGHADKVLDADDDFPGIYPGIVNGALELTDGRILSWSCDKTLRLWDGQSDAPLATLVGHTRIVWGALELSDGRILSWSHDKTLRLWDGQTGAPLSILEGHTAAVIDAIVLPDKQILSWSEDNTLCLWCEQSVQPASQPIQESSLHCADDQGRFPRLNVEYRDQISGSSFGWANRYTAGITSCISEGKPVCWHGQSAVESHTLFSEGILVISLASGHIFCPQLYRGARRITLADYEHASQCEPSRLGCIQAPAGQTSRSEPGRLR